MADTDRLAELERKFAENPRRYFAPLANELRKAGDLAAAVQLCRDQLARFPGHMSGHVVLGQALYESRRPDDARQAFAKALELDPENLIALRHLGDIARDAGDAGAARGWYQRVLEADPRNDDIAAQLERLTPAARMAPPAPVAAPAAFAPAAPPPPPVEPLEWSALDLDLPGAPPAPTLAGPEPAEPVAQEHQGRTDGLLDVDLVELGLAPAAPPVEEAAPEPTPELAPEPTPEPTPESAPAVAAAHEEADVPTLMAWEDFLPELPAEDVAPAAEAPAPAERTAPRDEPALLADAEVWSFDSPEAEAGGDRLDHEPPQAAADDPPATSPGETAVVGEPVEAEPVESVPFDAVESGAVEMVDAADSPEPVEAARREAEPAEVTGGAEPVAMDLAELELLTLDSPPPAQPDFEPVVEEEPVASAEVLIEVQAFSLPELESEAVSAVEPPAEPVPAYDPVVGLDLPPADPEPVELAGAAVEVPAAEQPAAVAAEAGVPEAAPEPTGNVPSPTFVTETMAELLLRQGHREEALGVYDRLMLQRPDDAALRARVVALREPPAPTSTAGAFFAALAAPAVETTPPRVAAIVDAVEPEPEAPSAPEAGLLAGAVSEADALAADRLASGFDAVDDGPSTLLAALDARPAAAPPPMPEPPAPADAPYGLAEFSFERFFEGLEEPTDRGHEAPEPASGDAWAFGDVPRSEGRTPTPASPATAVQPAPPPPEPAEDDDLAQFNAWLKGLIQP